MHLFVCVYGGNADTTAHVWKSQDNWAVLVLTFNTWVLGTKLRSAGLAASPSTCKTISPALKLFFKPFINAFIYPSIDEGYILNKVAKNKDSGMPAYCIGQSSFYKQKQWGVCAGVGAAQGHTHTHICMRA